MSDVTRKETKVVRNVSQHAPGEHVQKQTVVSGSSEKVAPTQTVVYVLYFLLSVIEILLAFRLILRMFGANPSTGFVSFIYNITRPFVSPFLGIFSPATAEGLETTAVFEPATLVGMIVYAVVVWMIIQLFVIMTRTPQENVE